MKIRHFRGGGGDGSEGMLFGVQNWGKPAYIILARSLTGTGTITTPGVPSKKPSIFKEIVQIGGREVNPSSKNENK